MHIRDARPEDMERLREIYAYYVLHTAVTFDYDVPTAKSFAERMKVIMAAYPYLVAEENDVVLGYAYAGPFVGRAAYRHSCETTIYVDHEKRRQGCGRALYNTLEARLKAMDIRNLYACIGDPIREDEYLTRDSELFHQRLGYTKVGEFHQCGYKFGRWYNMIWMEKLI